MAYIYDILLNFNEDLIEFFEWEDTDSIKYIKKVTLFKVDTKVIEDILYKKVIFSSDFSSKVPKYEMNGMKDAGSICLFTDGLIAIGVLIKESMPILFSRLLIDEEREVLEIAESLEYTNVKYVQNGEINKEKDSLTRKEKDMRKRLNEEIDDLFLNKNYDKLLYLYYEFTNKESSNFEYAYKYLKESLKNFEKRHKHLFEILLLSNANLTEK